MATNTTQVQHNLPLELDSFVGRTRDLDAILRLLDTHRVVTLCGIGGIGKTRLALRAAAQVVDRFSDGVWLCEMAETTTREEVVAQITSVLGVRSDHEYAPDQVLVDLLRSRHLLLLLDNCEHAIPACLVRGRAAAAPLSERFFPSHQPGTTAYRRGDLVAGTALDRA